MGLTTVASRSYLCSMRSVGLKVLKNKLSEYVRVAASGETVLITDRDRVVAELTPPAAHRSATFPDAMLAEAVRKGWVTPPLLSQLPTVPHASVLPLATLLDDLAADRNDG